MCEGVPVFPKPTILGAVIHTYKCMKSNFQGLIAGLIHGFFLVVQKSHYPKNVVKFGRQNWLDSLRFTCLLLNVKWALNAGIWKWWCSIAIIFILFFFASLVQVYLLVFVGLFINMARWCWICLTSQIQRLTMAGVGKSAQQIFWCIFSKSQILRTKSLFLMSGEPGEVLWRNIFLRSYFTLH